MVDPPFDATLRANAEYEFVPSDWLSGAQREQFGITRDDGKAYGIVRRRAANTGAVFRLDAEVALLFLTLQTTGPIPAHVRTTLGTAFATTLETLVADGVLEIEVGGTFFGGPRGLDALRRSTDPRPVAWETDPRSAAALRFAIASNATDARDVARLLYAYHRTPASAQWLRTLASPRDVERYLGIDGDKCELDFRSADGWYWWQSKSDSRTCRFKLYVSPRLTALPAALRAVLPHLRERASAVKFGADARNLLRPDRFIAYFPTFDALAEALSLVRNALEGFPEHGTPFTADAGNATLSWGIDGYGNEAASQTVRASWRQWVTMRIAESLVAAKSQHGNDDDAIWHFLIRRLALRGVDARTWTPSTSSGRIAWAACS